MYSLLKNSLVRNRLFKLWWWQTGIRILIIGIRYRILGNKTRFRIRNLETVYKFLLITSYFFFFNYPKIWLGNIYENQSKIIRNKTNSDFLPVWRLWIVFSDRGGEGADADLLLFLNLLQDILQASLTLISTVHYFSKIRKLLYILCIFLLFPQHL